MKPIIHRTHIIISPMNPDKAVSIDEFIEIESSKVDSSDLRKLGRLTGNLVAKMNSDQARQHHDMVEHVKVMCSILESPRIVASTDPLPKHLAELCVGANYILKGFDLIPDSIPEIGMTDDARVVARVFERNPTLSKLPLPS